VAGELPKDRTETLARDLLKTHAHEPVKQHLILDGAGRPFLVFTTYVGAQEGDPCTCDEYVYANPTSTQIVARQERIYSWKAAWDAAFTFDPTTDYDPDGDSIL